MRRARDEVEQLHGGTRGRVVAGLSLAAHIALLPEGAQPFRARYPQVDLAHHRGLLSDDGSGLRDGSVDFYVGPQPERPPPCGAHVRRSCSTTCGSCSGRRGHPLRQSAILRDLTDAEWATTSMTFKAEEEIGQLFRQHRLPPPRLALRSQSAVTLIVTLANTDLLAMVPIQWTGFLATDGVLAAIAGQGSAARACDRDGAPRRPAADARGGVSARSLAAQCAEARGQPEKRLTASSALQRCARYQSAVTNKPPRHE